MNKSDTSLYDGHELRSEDEHGDTMERIEYVNGAELRISKGVTGYDRVTVHIPGAADLGPYFVRHWHEVRDTLIRTCPTPEQAQRARIGVWVDVVVSLGMIMSGLWLFGSLTASLGTGIGGEILLLLLLDRR